MKPLKVISVYNRYRSRGGEDGVFEMETQILRQRGVDVLPVTEEVRVPEGLARSVQMAAEAVWSSRWFRKFQSLIRQHAPDVVHVHNFFPVMSPSIYYACQEAGVPVVQTLHNYRLFCPAATFFRSGRVCEECVEHTLWRSIRYGCYRDSRAATTAVASMLAFHRWRKTWTDVVDHYIALTEFVRAKFVGLGLPSDKLSVKPNFIHPDPGCRRGPGSYALFVGRLWDPKGVRTLLQAWELLGNRVPLRIVGDGPLLAELEEQKLRRGLSAVSFEGRLTSEATLQAIQNSRFLVMPSAWFESFPLVIIEAFACGVPVVASELGAMREVIRDGDTGLHVQPNDAEDLAGKVEWAWTNQGEMERMGKAARAEYEAKYTADGNYEMLMAIYRRAIESKSTS